MLAAKATNINKLFIKLNIKEDKMYHQEIHLANIKVIAKRRGLSVKDLAEKMGFTYVGMQKIIRENTTTLTTLNRIAEVLDVPVQLFFMSTDELGNAIDFSLDKFIALKEENKELKREIDELKNKIIRLADRL